MSDRNLILGVERSTHIGKIKSFSVHDLLRDLCINIGEQQEFFHLRKCGQTDGTERRIVVNYPSREKEFGSAVGARTVLRSIDNWKHSRCKLLRVLDKAVSIDHVPVAQVYGNVNLRYFAPLLSDSFRGRVELPTSTYLLWNLQTLIVEYAKSPPRSWDLTIVAPPEFWEMRQLRHFKCDRAILPVPRNRQASMVKLQTLWVAVNFRVSEEVCGMIPNIKKLGLSYYYTSQEYDDGLIDCLRNLERFDRLESLNLDIWLREWPPLEFEIHLKLAFPVSLTKLCLTNCKLSWEGISTVIGPLPRLRVLRLGINAAEGWECWRTLDGHFRSLKFLEIRLCDLHCWDADLSHFPVLEKLVLENLIYLKEIPPEIGEIATLGLIRVACCTESVAISAVKMKKDQVENYDNDGIQIEVRVYQEELESLKQRLEEEELDLNLLNLEA